MAGLVAALLEVTSESQDGSGGARRPTASRRYRNQIEVLRDFLSAVRDQPKKTRIMGLANLKSSTFEKYLAFSAGLDLVESVSGGYRLTSKAEATLAALEGFLARGTEVGNALRELQHSIGGSRAHEPHGDPGLRFVSRIAWSEVVLRSGSSAHDGKSRSDASAEDPLGIRPELVVSHRRRRTVL